MAIDFKTDIDGTAFNGITGLASVVSPVNGVAAVGTSTAVARQDHVHGTDTTRAPVASPTFTGSVVLPSATSIGNVSSTEVSYLDGVTSAIQTQFSGKANSSHTHAAGNITTGVLGNNGKIGLANHPEGGGLFTPSHDNDLAFIIDRGGAVSFYKTTDLTYTAQTLTNTGAIGFNTAIPFNGTTNYASTTLAATTDIVVCDITMPFSLSYGNTWYVDFGNTVWGAKNLSFYAYQSVNNLEAGYKLVGTAIVNSNEHLKFTSGSYSHSRSPSGTGYSYNRLRVVMTNWYGLSPRIAAIGARYYNSPGLSTTLLSLGGGTMYGSVKLNNLTASQTLELDASKNIISAAKQTGYNLALSTTATDIKVNGTQSLGSLSTLARADHVHPTDTSRAPTVSPTFTGTVVLPSGQALTSPTITGNGAIAGVFTGNITGNVIGNVQGDVIGNAATASKANTISIEANNTTNETTYLTFVDGATGTQSIETDTDLTYNPSTNVLTAGTFAGALSGNADTATKIASITNDNIVQLGAAQTLTFKTLLKPAIQAYATFIGDTSGTTRLQASEVAGTTVLTLPAETGTLVTLAGAETLAGKTLTSPVINSPTGLVKGDVGLGSVDNTSDAGKPVSTATQNALNLKATLASPTFTGTVNGISKGMVGLGSVDDTADSAKNVLSATKLTSERTIGGVSFDGSANIPQRETTHHSASFTFAVNTRQYIGLLRADSENATVSNIFLPFLAPFNGKLLKVFVRSSNGLTGGNLKLRLEKNALDVPAATTTPTTAATMTLLGPTNSAMTTYDFTNINSPDSGSNTITAGDMIFISIESTAAFTGVKIFFTFLWEWDH